MGGSRIDACEVFAVDLPFRVRFKHSAAARSSSESLFVKCVTSDGTVGFGEGLPRVYVTGESRDEAFTRLAESVLPQLVGRNFDAYEEVEGFLRDCDGRAPADWLPREVPQGAAWAAVDLALLDAFGKVFGSRPLPDQPTQFPQDLRYSAVMSAETGLKRFLMLAAYRGVGFRHMKLKVGPETTDDVMRRIRTMVGGKMALRTDANMGWTVDEALERMREFAQHGVRCHEQPLPVAEMDGLARLVKESGCDIMADESCTTRESLDALIAHRACTAINARVSKCGGLVATWKRCREALDAGLLVQVGCQVGESSVLSAAHLRLCAAVQRVTFAEGCFGRLLLREDPGSPRLQFRRGGRPPRCPEGPGLGIGVDEEMLKRYSAQHIRIG